MDASGIGNAADRGSDLVPDLMNGVGLLRGTRYSISPLDLAMMHDMGVELAPGVLIVPEPEIYLLMLPSLGLLALVVGRRARAKRCRRLARRLRCDVPHAWPECRDAVGTSGRSLPMVSAPSLLRR